MCAVFCSGNLLQYTLIVYSIYIIYLRVWYIHIIYREEYYIYIHNNYALNVVSSLVNVLY